MQIPSQGRRYHSTRHAWEDIWDKASIEAELETAASTRAQKAIAAFRPFLPKDAPILEAGSGLSAIVITLRRMGYPVQGLDYAVNALVASKAYDQKLPLVGGDVHALPYANDSLGAYLSFGVLEHFEHGMGPALLEAYRVLRPGGILMVTVPYPNLIHRVIRWRRRAQAVSELNDDTFYESAYTKAALVGEVERAGFGPLMIKPTSHSFTFWGIGGPFRAPGYYRTSRLAESLGQIASIILPWALNYMTMIVARKPES
jgi:SAM-dependent methyltransferase